MLGFLLGLFPDFLKVYLGFKADEAESLGKAEQKSTDLQVDLNIANAEAKAAANAPTDKQSLIDALKSHKAVFLLLILSQVTSCASNVTSGCPAIRDWTPIQQDEIAATLSTLPPDSPLIAVGIEWFRLREESKACHGG